MNRRARRSAAAVALAVGATMLPGAITGGGAELCAQTDTNGCAYERWDACFHPHHLVGEEDRTCADPFWGCWE